MDKTKIDWADYRWNPVWGCRNNCPYCYARGIAKRSGKSFEPHWMEKNFQKPVPEEPSFIFVNSMSDIAFWEVGWIRSVLRRIEANPQHIFIVLTKRPDIYASFDEIAPTNCWFGTTITRDGFPEIPLSNGHINFVSIEPILEHINLWGRHMPEKPLDWIIIGAETGNRKEKVVPEFHWINDIVYFAQNENIPIWMKESLKEIWHGSLIQERPRRVAT